MKKEELKQKLSERIDGLKEEPANNYYLGMFRAYNDCKSLVDDLSVLDKVYIVINSDVYYNGGKQVIKVCKDRYEAVNYIKSVNRYDFEIEEMELN